MADHIFEETDLNVIIGTGIKFNQSISELFLGDNFLVATDASTLAAMLKSNTTLQLLDVRNNMLQVCFYTFFFATNSMVWGTIAGFHSRDTFSAWWSSQK